MKQILAMLAGMALALNAQATITLDIDAEALKDQFGTRIPEGSGLVLVVADTSQGGFVGTINQGSSLALGGFLNGGDDRIVARYAVTSGGFGDGDFQVAATGLVLGGNWGAGDGLAIYWFSNASLADSSAAAGMHYNHNVSTKDANWVTPGDGGTVSMGWFTTDATDLFNLGSVAAINGNTSLTVVPEPSTSSLLVLGIAGLLAIRRKK